MIFFIIFGAFALAPLIVAYFMQNKPLRNQIIKAVLSIISFFGFAFFGLLFATVVMMSDFFGDGGFGLLLPLLLCLAVYSLSILLVWRPFRLKTRVIFLLSITGFVIALVTVFIIPTAYDRSIPVSREEVYLPEYTPFGRYWYVDGELTHHESLAAKLNEPSTLSLTGELPRLDGATALYPLYAAFVQATYPAPEPALDIPEFFPYGDLSDDSYPSLAVCSRTATAYINLIDGNADIVFLMGVSDVQRQWAAERGYELILTPVGREAFVFFVNNRNTVSNISTTDIKRIYSGEITNWRDVGGKNNEIIAYQRPDSSGSQVMLREIMGDIPIMPLNADTEIFDTMMMMYSHIASSYKNYKNALGYSFLYYIRDMINENKVKFLTIDSIAPTEDNIASGAYPFANDFYAVTIKKDGEYLNPERTENIDKLLEWIQSPQGQYLVEATGYVLLPQDKVSTQEIIPPKDEHPTMFVQIANPDLYSQILTAIVWDDEQLIKIEEDTRIETDYYIIDLKKGTKYSSWFFPVFDTIIDQANEITGLYLPDSGNKINLYFNCGCGTTRTYLKEAPHFLYNTRLNKISICLIDNKLQNAFTLGDKIPKQSTDEREYYFRILISIIAHEYAHVLQHSFLGGTNSSWIHDEGFAQLITIITLDELFNVGVYPSNINHIDMVYNLVHYDLENALSKHRHEDDNYDNSHIGRSFGFLFYLYIYEIYGLDYAVDVYKAMNIRPAGSKISIINSILGEDIDISISFPVWFDENAGKFLFA